MKDRESALSPYARGLNLTPWRDLSRGFQRYLWFMSFCFRNHPHANVAREETFSLTTVNVAPDVDPGRYLHAEVLLRFRLHQEGGGDC